MKSPVDLYLNAVKKELRGYVRERRDFMCGLSRELTGFTKENPQSDLSALCQAFGTPGETARQFLEDLDPAVRRAARKRKAAGLLLLLLLLLLVILFLAKSLHLSRQVDLGRVEVIITQSEPYSLTEEEIDALKQQAEEKNNE